MRVFVCKGSMPHTKAGRVEVPLENALRESLEHSSAEGQLERLRDILDNTNKAVILLFKRAAAGERVTAEDIDGMLSYHYEVEDEDPTL